MAGKDTNADKSPKSSDEGNFDVQTGDTRENQLATPLPAIRSRRTTEKFTIEFQRDEASDFEPPKGRGTKLREMQKTAEKVAQMGKKDAETLKVLYSVFYSRRFQLKNIKVIKEHILDFSGINDVDDKVRDQLMQKIGRWTRGFLQTIMDILGVDRSKKSFDEEGKSFDKESLMNRLVDWLCEPQESEKTRASKAKASPKGKTGDKVAGAKRKSPKAKPASSKKQKTSRSETATKKTTKKSKGKSNTKEHDEDEETESEVENPDESSDDSSSDFDGEKPAASKRARKAPSQSTEDHATPLSHGKSDKQPHPSAAPSVLPDEVQRAVSELINGPHAAQLTLKKVMNEVGKKLERDDMKQYKTLIKEFITQS